MRSVCCLRDGGGWRSAVWKGRRLGAKGPSACPPHLRPLARRVLLTAAAGSQPPTDPSLQPPRPIAGQKGLRRYSLAKESLAFGRQSSEVRRSSAVCPSSARTLSPRKEKRAREPSLSFPAVQGGQRVGRMERNRERHGHTLPLPQSIDPSRILSPPSLPLLLFPPSPRLLVKIEVFYCLEVSTVMLSQSAFSLFSFMTSWTRGVRYRISCEEGKEGEERASA